MPVWRIPLVDLPAQHRAIAAELADAVGAVIAQQKFILGEPVERFERTIAALVGTTHAIGVASGSDAILLALAALDIGPGDAVVLPAFGFVASAEAVVRAGARPLFADVEGFHLTAKDLEAVLAATTRRQGGSLVHRESGAVVRAALPVHLYGSCSGIRELHALASQHGLLVVEDAAQAIGAASRGKQAGSFGDAGALSFFPSKNLGGWGDGGAVITSRDDVAARIRRLRIHGAPEYEETGTNSRLDALQAAILDAKARHLDAWTNARIRAAARYRDLFAHLAPTIVLPAPEAAGDRHVYNQFVILAERRDSLLEHLGAHGIESRAYYPRAVPRLPAFARFLVADGASLEGADRLAQPRAGRPHVPGDYPQPAGRGRRDHRPLLPLRPTAHRCWRAISAHVPVGSSSRYRFQCGRALAALADLLVAPSRG